MEEDEERCANIQRKHLYYEDRYLKKIVDLYLGGGVCSATALYQRLRPALRKKGTTAAENASLTTVKLPLHSTIENAVPVSSPRCALMGVTPEASSSCDGSLLYY